MDTKSRFPSLRLFKFNGANGHNSHSSQSQSQSHSPQPQSALQPPHPPPKDRNGNNSALFYTSSSVGAASTPDLSYHSKRSPSSDSPRFLSPVSPFAHQTSSFPSTSSLVSPTLSLRKSLTKISSFGRRSTKSTNIPHSPSLDVLPECNDEGISAPYNFQHNIHVNDTLQGMPPSWLTTLLAAGFSEEEINRLRGRQRAATHLTAAADAPVYVGSTMATFPGTYTTARNLASPLSQFGELQRAPSTSTTPSQNTHLHRNYHNPSTSISMFSSSVCSSSDERESLSPSPHAVQQPILSPSYTQHFTGYTPSAQTHQTYPHSDTTRSHSPTETRSRSPTEAVTYSQHSTGMNQSELRNAITPPINTSNYHPVMYRIVNEDPTPTTPPPAYASPKSPYRFTEKGSEKAFRWDVSSSTPGEGPSALSVTPPLVTEQEPTHPSPMQSHRFMHIANQTSETGVSPILVPEEPPLFSSTRFNRPLSSNASQVETIIGEDRHEDDDANGRVTPSLASSPTNDSLELNAGTRTDYEGHSSMECPLEQPPNLTAEPPRLSLHTDQDDDWSTILRFSFSGGVNSMDPNIGGHGFQTADPNQSSSLPATMPLTLKSKRASRRSSVIYGPRGSPCAKEKPFPSAETKVHSTGGLAMGVLHEQEERSPAIVHSAVQDGFTEDEEDWADNYLDMKDGDYESSEELDTLNENRSQEVFQEVPVSRTLGCDSPITYSSPRVYTGLSPSVSLPCSAEQHEDDSATQIIAEYGSMDDESSHVIRSSHFSNNTVRPSSPQTIQYALPSPSSLRRVSATPLYSAAPLSPSTPVFPTLSPTSAMRPSSIISRRSFDLPPPLPPPEDDLPPTPEEAAAMGRITAVSPKWPAHGMQIMQGATTHADVWAEQDSQRSLPPITTSSSNRQSSQRLLSSPSTSIPTTPLSRRELPPVPLQVNTGARHTHTPMSSISSVPTHSRSASGHLSNPIQSTVGRPPPLPLPPLGKVLPSVIMQQRRAAAAKNDLQLSKSATFHGLSTVVAHPNLTPSSSPSTFSHSSKSAYSPDTSETGSVSDNRKTSTVHGDSYPIRVSHVSLTMDSQAADEVSLPQSEAVDTSDYVIGTNSDEIKHIREEDVWLAGTEDFKSSDQENTGPSDTLRNSISESTISSVPPTPSIAVNGFTIPTTQDLIAIPEQVLPKSPQMHFISAELPLVLYPIKEYISTGVDPLDIFFELQEIAQGQYGSVYMAQVQSEGDDSALAVAVKQVPIPMKGTPKIGQLKRELSLMSKIRHKHILETLALFYEPSESMLWIQMELMERSLADILALGEEGLEIQERVIARFASDILLALTYLNEQRLSHRDVRSDNLLMNRDGILKLADLSNAVQVPQSNSIRLDIVGIHHWQAPEIRRSVLLAQPSLNNVLSHRLSSGRYDALKIDVWSLGATVWECAEFIPPFSDVEDLSALGVRWPPISRAEEFSKDFHDFLRLCSEPATSRPPASRLLRHPFIQVACPRVDVLSLLNWCRSIEESMRIN